MEFAPFEDELPAVEPLVEDPIADRGGEAGAPVENSKQESLFPRSL
jgi:hypothetical protein